MCVLHENWKRHKCRLVQLSTCLLPPFFLPSFDQMPPRTAFAAC